MPTFTVHVSDDVSGWFSNFLTQLTNCFQGVSSQMDELESSIGDKLDALMMKRMNKLDTSIGAKFEALRTTINTELSDVKKIAIGARELAESNAKALESMEQRMNQCLCKLEKKCNSLAAKNIQLTEQQEQQSTYSRKEILVVRGVNEVAAEETKDMCVAAVRHVLINNLNIDADSANKMVIVRCHRMGRKDNSGAYHRPIIVRFLNFNDRQLVWNKRLALPNSAISLSENFSSVIESRRQLLYPIMKKAKRSSTFEKVQLKADKLILDKVEYSVADGSLSNLPANLDPVQFSSRSDNNWIIFGGRHSIFNPLSNYYPEPVVHKDILHDTVEHAYQFAKASRYGDRKAEEAILCASSPAEAKQAGRTVSNFDRVDWNVVKKMIMLDLLRIKFKDGSEVAKFLKATTGKSLAEAGKSKSFAIGVSLNHKNIFNTRQWPKDCNILGKCLMEIRNELNR